VLTVGAAQLGTPHSRGSIVDDGGGTASGRSVVGCIQQQPCFFFFVGRNAESGHWHHWQLTRQEWTDQT
jgi:hypothetical protein